MEYLVADEEKLKWLGSLEDLKLFTESSLCLDGKWSSPGGFAKKFTLKSVEPDQQQFGFVWYRQKQNTIVFQGDVMSIESAKSRLLSIANKQNVASIVESEQLFDELDCKRVIQSRVAKNLLRLVVMVLIEGSATRVQLQLLVERARPNVLRGHGTAY